MHCHNTWSIHTRFTINDAKQFCTHINSAISMRLLYYE